MTKKQGGRDFADVADDLGGDAIRAAIDGAGPKVKLPWGFKVKPDGLYFEDDGDGGPMKLCGAAVLSIG